MKKNFNHGGHGGILATGIFLVGILVSSLVWAADYPASWSRYPTPWVPRIFTNYLDMVTRANPTNANRPVFILGGTNVADGWGGWFLATTNTSGTNTWDRVADTRAGWSWDRVENQVHGILTITNLTVQKIYSPNFIIDNAVFITNIGLFINGTNLAAINPTDGQIPVRQGTNFADLTIGDGLTNSARTLKVAIEAGSNITLATNNGKITIAASGGSTPAYTMIGPLTPGFMPYASGPTNLADGPWYRISTTTNAIGFRDTNVFLYYNYPNGTFGIGRDALYTYAATGGSGGPNTVYGPSAGYALTSGGVNTLIGNGAGSAITFGGYNVAIGEFALLNGASPLNAVAIGAQASYTGGGGVAIGKDAQYSMAPGGAIGTAVGTGVGYFSTNVSSSVFLGDSAGAIVGSGSRNVIIGPSSTFGISGQTSGSMQVSDSVVIGRRNTPNPETLTNLLTSVIVGASTRTNTVTTATNSVAIGFNVQLQGNNIAQIGTNGVSVLFLNGTVGWYRGSGDPNTLSITNAPISSYYSREDGGAGTSFYVKENLGANWVAK